MIDVIVGDVVQFYYIKFNTQVVVSGTVVEVLDDKVILELSNTNEVEVPYTYILKRCTRNPIVVPKKVQPVDPDVTLNQGIRGVRFRHRKRERRNDKKD